MLGNRSNRHEKDVIFHFSTDYKFYEIFNFRGRFCAVASCITLHDIDQNDINSKWVIVVERAIWKIPFGL